MTANITNCVAALLRAISKVIPAFGMLLCCFLLGFEPQATAQDDSGRNPAAKVTQIKPAIPAAAVQASPASDQSKPSDRRVVRQGIAVDLSVKPLSALNGAPGKLREGDYVTFQLKISYTTTGVPLKGAHPAAWMDRQHLDTAENCTAKVKDWIGGSILNRPQFDLNSYYVLALNDDATISVIDPHLGFGGSKLFAMVGLHSAGEDWVTTTDGRTLFVSMPDSNQVAVVDTLTWKILTNIKVGPRPARIELQPDGHNIWVGYGSPENAGEDSGVAVIDVEGLKLAARIPTGKGLHQIALSDDSRFAFVTNSEVGTVSVIDVPTLKKLKDIQTGRRPSSIAFSTKARMAYVANLEDGAIVAVDASQLKVVAKIQGKPGLAQIKFAPDGRFGFVANPAKDLVHIFDAATNRILQTADIKNAPDQISFSNSLAYVRSQRSEIVTMIGLPRGELAGQPVAVFDFPGGQQPLGKASRPSPASAIVQAPGEDAVLVGNPTDRSIYYYKEGMAAPMGTFSNYGREPRAVLVIDRSLKERSPGVYETTARLTRAGLYDLAFLLDTPRILHCFPIRVEADPDAVKAQGVRIEPLLNSRVVWVGEKIRLRFKLSDLNTKEPQSSLTDVNSLIWAPGGGQQRQSAIEVGKGLYEIEFQPPEAGIYYVYLEVPSLGLEIDNPQMLILEARTKP